jgi:hypothetical protein
MEDYGYINKRLKLEMDNRSLSAKKKRISAIFATIIRQGDLSKEDLKEIKRAFSLDYFMQFSEDTLYSEITKWTTEWITKWTTIR